jgi:hypothetical protein
MLALLPPSSNVMFFKVRLADAMIRFPVAVDPVKLISEHLDARRATGLSFHRRVEPG